jgi:hypothetical protein
MVTVVEFSEMFQMATQLIVTVQVILPGPAGGIFGNSATGNSYNCYSTGNISESWWVVFSAQAEMALHLTVTAVGNIGSNSGGILGGYSSGTAANCYSLGTIGSGAEESEALIFSGSVNNCYFTGGAPWVDNDANVNLSGVGTTWMLSDPPCPTNYPLLMKSSTARTMQMFQRIHLPIFTRVISQRQLFYPRDNG